MNLDRDLLNVPPITNPFVENGFKLYPVYARQELLRGHKHRLHIQPGIEINLTLEGKAAYVIGNQIYMQSPGNLIIFSGLMPHQVYIDPSCEYKRTVICFDEIGLQKEAEFHKMPTLDFNGLSGPTYRQILLNPEMFANIRWIVNRISEEIQERNSDWKQVVSSQLVSLAVFINRSMKAIDSNVNSDPVSVCCDYIDKHLHEDLSLKSVARMSHISPEHLTRQFKREKGSTFYQYVLQQRVLESKRLLRNCPEMTITDIAYAAGFASAAQFSRVFKSSTQMLPSQYRHHSHCAYL
jgi:AraC-like DNA-binding protein